MLEVDSERVSVSGFWPWRYALRFITRTDRERGNDEALF